MSTVYPSHRGRQHAVQLGAADAKALLKSKLPFLLPILTPAEIGQVQKVLDAAVVNPALQKDYADAARKNAAAERARGVFSDGAVYRTPDSPQMRKISAELIDVTKGDKHIRLQHPKLLAHDALKALSDNPDEAAYLNKIMRALSNKGVYLRIEPSRVRDPDDRSHLVNSDKEFDVWLSYGVDGDTIPTKDGRLTRDNLLDTTTIGAGFYTDVINGVAQTRFKQAADRLSRFIEDGMDRHSQQEIARVTAAPGVVTIADFMGRAGEYPTQKIWDFPSNLLTTARAANREGDMYLAGIWLSFASFFASLAAERLNNYTEATIKGAGRAAVAIIVIDTALSCLEIGRGLYAAARAYKAYKALKAVKAATTVVKVIGQREARKEITREAFGRMLKSGKSTFRPSPLKTELNLNWLEDVKKVFHAAEKRGIHITPEEFEALERAASAKWGI
jgi:hypothetical protein